MLGALLLIQAIGYSAYVYATKGDLTIWRRQWLGIAVSGAIWSVAVDVVSSQISIWLAAVSTAMTFVRVAFMVLVYIGLRRRRLS